MLGVLVMVTGTYQHLAIPTEQVEVQSLRDMPPLLDFPPTPFVVAGEYYPCNGLKETLCRGYSAVF